MGSISIILRRPPYGTVDAPEAIRHALGGITEDMAVRLILVDGGVTAAKKGQDISNNRIFKRRVWNKRLHRYGG